MNEMSLVTTLNADGVKTMSSLDMVAYINASREAGKPELQHKEFLRKVPTVLGELMSAQFYAHIQIPGPRGGMRPSPVYNFDEEAAVRMAMSYSYELQRVVYRAWKAAEAKVAEVKDTVAIPNFNDPVIAARAWANEVEAAQVLQLKLTASVQEVAEAQPKIAFYDTVVADEHDMPFDEAAKLLGIGRNKFVNWLKLNGYIQRNRVPYQRSINSGWLASSIAPRYVTSSGKLVEPTTYVTPKGLAYFHGKLAAGTVQKAAA